jgi:hypothetical protein
VQSDVAGRLKALEQQLTSLKKIAATAAATSKLTAHYTTSIFIGISSSRQPDWRMQAQRVPVTTSIKRHKVICP